MLEQGVLVIWQQLLYFHCTDIDDKLIQMLLPIIVEFFLQLFHWKINIFLKLKLYKLLDRVQFIIITTLQMPKGRIANYTLFWLSRKIKKAYINLFFSNQFESVEKKFL